MATPNHAARTLGAAVILAVLAPGTGPAKVAAAQAAQLNPHPRPPTGGHHGP